MGNATRCLGGGTDCRTIVRAWSRSKVTEEDPLLEAAICLALDRSDVADRVAGVLTRFGYQTIDSAASSCPSVATAVITDRPSACECRRSWGAGPAHAAVGCEVPLIRVGRFESPDHTGDAFVTLELPFTDEALLIAVTRAVRYAQHLARMRAVRSSSHR